MNLLYFYIQDCFYIPWQNIMGDLDQDSVIKIFQGMDGY